MSAVLDMDGIDTTHAGQIRAIIEILRANGPMTRCELERAGGWRPNQVSGRVHEARERGWLQVVATAKCMFHEARGSVEVLDVAPWLRDGAGKQRRLDRWGVSV